MFYVDKYQIKKPFQVMYNKEIYNKFLHKSKQNFIPWKSFYSMPNLCVYGRPGSGKRSFINILLNKMFGNIVNDISKQTYQIRGYGNSTIEVQIDQSPVHIIIKPNNTGFDKYYVQEIVKSYAADKSLEFHNNNNRFKVVIIDSIDNMSYYAQTSLRRTMETYSSNCKFIFCCYELSKVIEPLRSRCLLLNIPSPKYFDMMKILLYVNQKEGLNIDYNELNKIVLNSNNNTKTLLWNLECYKNKIEVNYIYNKKIEFIVKKIINISKKKIQLDDLKDIRSSLYKIFITNFNEDTILNSIVTELIKRTENIELRQKLLDISCKYYIRLNIGKRTILHLEALIFNLMHCIYMNAKEEYKKSIETKSLS
jgi:replication factor C subunit 3/5